MRHYCLSRENGNTECDFGHNQWELFVETIKLAGWEPEGTLLYTYGHPWMYRHGFQKDQVSHYETRELSDITTPEELARLEAELTGQAFDELVESYRKQWGANCIEIRSHIKPDWSGSYYPASTAYVSETDALAMSKALNKVAKYLETHRSIEITGTMTCEKLRVARSKYQYDYKEHVVVGPCSYFQWRTLKAVPAFQKFAEWTSKGEFRIN